MADSPLERLQDVARDAWADPVAAASAAARAILELLDGGWSDTEKQKVSELRRRRADSPYFLVVTEAALTSGHEGRRRALQALLEQLEDSTWADDLGMRIAHYASLGVVSLGDTTLAALESARGIGGTSAALFTDRRAIARGLSFLGLAVEVAPPEQAEAVLLPAAAIAGSRVWTSVRAADVALRTALNDREIVVVAHPLASLSPRNRADFRPASTLIDVSI